MRKLHWQMQARVNDMSDLEFISPFLKQVPNDDANPSASMEFILRRAMENLECCLPAEILAFDRAENVATIRPLIMKTGVDNQQYERGEIYNINVLSLGGGGFNISFPLKRGDLGWIVSADRDLSLFKASLNISPPNTGRTHNFADCWFVPDKFRNYVINEEDAEFATFQSEDGNSRVSVGQSQIRITVGSTKITLVDGKITLDTQAAEINAPGGTVINSNTTINGTLSVRDQVSAMAGVSVAGDMVGQGNITTTGEGIFGGINATTHRHTDGEGRLCSPPIP